MSLEIAADFRTHKHAQSTRAIAELLRDAVGLAGASARFVSRHRLGPIACRLVSNDPEAGELLTRCLIRDAIGIDAQPELEVFLLCGSSAPFAGPPAWNLPHTDSRHRERLHLSPDGDISASYSHDHRIWTALDKARGQGLIWVADSGDIPFWEEAAPFKLLLHWFLADTRLALVHGGVVAADGRGVLLAGPGGSGKSTTVAACFQAGLAVCGDDLVMVEESEAGWRAHAVYDAVKLSPHHAIPIPPVFAAAPSRPCGTKRLSRYTDARPEGLAATSPLVALIQCVIAEAAVSALAPLPAPAMLRALAPPTAFLLRGRETETLRKIGALVRALPCYRLELGKDPSEAAALLGSSLKEARI